MLSKCLTTCLSQYPNPFQPSRRNLLPRPTTNRTWHFTSTHSMSLILFFRELPKPLSTAATRNDWVQPLPARCQLWRTRTQKIVPLAQKWASSAHKIHLCGCIYSTYGHYCTHAIYATQTITWNSPPAWQVIAVHGGTGAFTIELQCPGRLYSAPP